MLAHPPKQKEEDVHPWRQIREPAASRRPVLHFLHSWSPTPASISRFRGSSQKTVLPSAKPLGLTGAALCLSPFHREVSRVILTSVLLHVLLKFCDGGHRCCRVATAVIRLLCSQPPCLYQGDPDGSHVPQIAGHPTRGPHP